MSSLIDPAASFRAPHPSSLIAVSEAGDGGPEVTDAAMWWEVPCVLPNTLAHTLV